MAMTRRVSLFEREVKVRLAPAAVDLLHTAARVLSEGELTGDLYAGSTMLTVDLSRTTATHRMRRPPSASRFCMPLTSGVAITLAGSRSPRPYARQVSH
jgi:hypothetical protein